MTNNYPEYVDKIIPADIKDEMTDNREETITDLGIAVMGGVKGNMENPFATAQGQIVSSISESSVDRAIREGVVKVTETTQTNPAGGVYGAAYTVPAATIAQVEKICVSTNATSPVSINCSVRITTGVAGESTKEFKQFVTIDRELSLDFPFVLGTGGKIEFRANTGFGFTGLLICSTIVIEKPLV